MDIIENILKIFSKLSVDNWITIVAFSALSVFLKMIYPKFRGYMGEFWIKDELNKLSKDKYKILNDIMLEDEKGTHQIDHVVMSTNKIFVIEMKNYYGYIIGKEYDNKWCQYLGRKRFFFNNPIHQNYGHIKCLSAILNIEEDNFVSIVCFSNQAKLKVKSNSIVTQVDFIKDEILKLSTDSLIYDLNALTNNILSKNIIDRKKRHLHVKNIKAKIEKATVLENNMICPKCGDKLIEKRGKYGKFIGCSNYPKCKYIKKL